MDSTVSYFENSVCHAARKSVIGDIIEKLLRVRVNSHLWHPA